MIDPLVVHLADPLVDPLAAEACVNVKEEIEFFELQPQDHEELNNLLQDDTENDDEIASNDPLEFDPDEEEADVIFVGVGNNGYLAPIQSLRDGLLKRDDDEISGNLCYQTTVRNVVLLN